MDCIMCMFVKCILVHTVFGIQYYCMVKYYLIEHFVSCSCIQVGLQFKSGLEMVFQFNSHLIIRPLILFLMFPWLWLLQAELSVYALQCPTGKVDNKTMTCIIICVYVCMYVYMYLILMNYIL